MGFDFDEEGFMTERYLELEKDTADLFQSQFEIATIINQDCHVLLISPSIHRDDKTEIIVSTLLSRALEHYQGTIIMARRQMVAAASVTLRALLEVTFRIQAIANNPDSIEDFLSEDIQFRQKSANKLRHTSDPILASVRAKITDEMVESLKEEIRAAGSRQRTTEHWAKLAGMEAFYVAHYTILSSAVHTKPHDLDTYLIVDDNNRITGLKYAHSVEKIPDLILASSGIILTAAHAFDTVFNCGFSNREEELRALIRDAYDDMERDRVPS